MTTVKIEQDVEAADFWSAVMGSAGTSWGWWLGEEYLSGSWDVPGVVRLTITDPDDEDKAISKDVTLDDLVEAYKKAVVTSRDPFTGANLEWDNLDASGSDCILQTAVLGEVVYG
jgi:hypothetical protein